MKLVGAVLASLCLLACGAASTRVREPLAARAKTAGDSLLASVPVGADLVLEVDLRRLRDNPVVGPLLQKLSPPEPLESSDLLQVADAAVLCVYDIGQGPRQLVLLRVARERVAGARRLGAELFALGDAELLNRAEALPGDGASMAGDRGFLRLRSQPMPAKAESAALRLALRLDFDARVSVAAQVEMSDVPVSVSVWGDVVDDLAIVADLATEEAAGIGRLQRALEGMRSRLASAVWIRYLGLAPALQEARVIRSARGVRVVFLIRPKRLALVIDRILKQLAKPAPS
jgi:hypothetical protein